jgi:hypothetical protein
MITEKESAFRILSHREDRVRPMFDVAPIGPLSPLSSLLVERRDLTRMRLSFDNLLCGGLQTHSCVLAACAINRAEVCPG